MTNPEIPSTESSFDRTRLEQAEAEYIEKMIEGALIHGFKFDEGQNAIIMEVNPDDLLPEVRDYFFQGQESLMPNEAFVSKTLKIYRAGAGEQEAAMQDKAKEIIDSQENKDELAQVPELYIERDIIISDPELKTQLEQSGVDVSADKVSVMLMYKVQGVDVMHYLLREAIKRTPENELAGKNAVGTAQQQLINDPRAMSSAEVFQAASVAIGFESSDRVTLNEINRGRLLNYLKKYEFVLDPAVMIKIEKTLKVLNDNNFYHNDLTERNVMFELDEQGQIMDVYLIDFETASDQEDENFGGDMAILGNYKTLTQSNSQRTERLIHQELDKGHKLAEIIKKAKPEFYDSLKEILNEIIGQSDSSREAELISLASREVGDEQFDLLGAILMEIAETNLDGVKSYIDLRLADQELNARYCNLLGRIKGNI